jgi:hypothetical protein
MRAFDRDLVRGAHYGQRSCEPRKQAEHMAAATKCCKVKILLANPEPSTHGRSRHFAACGDLSLGMADMLALGCWLDPVAHDPEPTLIA